MGFPSYRRTSDKDSDTEHVMSRRGLLETTAVAAAGATGLGVVSGPAVADSDEIMELDLRDGVPPVTDAPQGEDEVIFSVHGYTNSDNSVSEAQQLQDTLRSLGNTETVTAVTWDDSGFPSTAEASARDQGGVFADWMDRYLDENPDTTIRILGHSMGGIVTFEFVSSADGRFTVANADSIGSYEVSDAPCEGTEFHDSIDTATKFTGNYFSTNDDVARLGDGPAECSSGSLPANYADVDVSDSVPDHNSYKESSGCVQKIVDNYQTGVDRSGDDGTSDGTSPTIDSLNAAEETWGDDVEVDWDVSDGDGDLATAESVLLDSSGNTLDTASSSISGSSASGMHELDPGWDTADRVEFTVTDSDGNSASQSEDV